MTTENQAGAIELSDQELDTVSGGTGLDLGNIDSFMTGSASDFMQRNLSMDQMTFAGPGGAGTLTSMDFQEIASSARQFTAID